MLMHFHRVRDQGRRKDHEQGLVADVGGFWASDFDEEGVGSEVSDVEGIGFEDQSEEVPEEHREVHGLVIEVKKQQLHRLFLREPDQVGVDPCEHQDDHCV